MSVSDEPEGIRPRGAPLPPGTLFARRYRIGDVIGTGGTGIVYEAMPVGPLPNVPEQHEPVALKLIHRHLVANEQVSRRFSREADILQRLKGEHLVPLLDFGQDRETGRLFLALQRIYGVPLDLVLQRDLPTVEAAGQIIVGVCDALGCAHEQGVIHRDLKPANVLLEEHPSELPYVRVFDFGLARVLRSEEGALTTLTGQNMIFGTPEYMAPEQIRGEELDPRGDVYAAGALLYELLTGRVPFLGATNIATMTAHLNDPLPPPSVRAPTRAISQALDHVTLRALAKRRDDRYPSAAAFREALANALTAASSDRHLSTTLNVSALTPSSVNPFEATLSISGDDPLLLSPDPSAEAPVSVADSGRPTSQPSGRITADALVRSVPPTPPRPWVWILVAVTAALIGMTIGIVVARRG